MPTLTWDALGGDPTPGDPTAYDELDTGFSQTSANAGEAHGKLTRFQSSVDSNIWRGESADAFRDKISDLPPKLQKLHDSYVTAAGAMAGYARILRDLQAQAATLLAHAQDAAAEVDDHTRARTQALAADPHASTASFDQAINDAQGRQESLRRQIEDLRQRRQAAENAALHGLDDAHDLGIQNDSWFSHAWDAVKQWVDDHVDLLKTISSILKGISAIAGLLSFIPFLAPICGPIALISAGLALGIDFVLCATGHGSWKAFAIDAALMALPVAGRFASELRGGGDLAMMESRSNSVLSDVGSELHPHVPTYEGGPARGVMRVGKTDIPLQSGENGPGRFLKENLAGGTGSGLTRAWTHVEGHTAGLMHEFNIKEAELFINKVPCGVGAAKCRFVLNKLLPEGSSLLVHFPGEEGGVTTWLFQHGVPKWTPVP